MAFNSQMYRVLKFESLLFLLSPGALPWGVAPRPRIPSHVGLTLPHGPYPRKSNAHTLNFLKAHTAFFKETSYQKMLILLYPEVETKILPAQGPQNRIRLQLTIHLLGSHNENGFWFYNQGTGCFFDGKKARGEKSRDTVP
jgi:hypothetical protein